MRNRVWLTILWFAMFVGALFALNAYAVVHDSNGQVYILPEERSGVLKPIIILYALYLGEILAFWYVRPAAKVTAAANDPVRFRLALLATVVFNAVIFYFLLEPYWQPVQSVQAAVHTAVAVARWSSFLVAPVIAFYFGGRAK